MMELQFGFVCFLFVKIIHIQLNNIIFYLTYERRNVCVIKMLGNNISRKELGIIDKKRSSMRVPTNNLIRYWVRNNLPDGLYKLRYGVFFHFLNDLFLNNLLLYPKKSSFINEKFALKIQKIYCYFNNMPNNILYKEHSGINIF